MTIGSGAGADAGDVRMGIVIGTTSGAALGVAGGVLLTAMRQRPPRGRCPNCGYQKRGLPTTICPECGHDHAGRA